VTDVSVLTPSYGYGRFIADSIESVLGQQGPSLEHIVQDGGSEDETVQVLRSFGDQVIWTSERDSGQSDALNRALAKASGTWVAWLNADEYYLPGGLAALIREGERRRADVVYGDSVAVDREGKVIALRPQHPFSPLILRFYGPFPDSVSMVVRRSILGTGPWDHNLRVVMDWDLLLGLLARGASFHYSAYPVGAFRQHEDQASARPRSGEASAVRERHSIPTSRWYRRGGLALHRVRKLMAGSYVRQLRAMAFRGSDLRWFREDVGTASSRALLSRCYGLGTETQS
jgi:glycosyltransferase involved in cell wall biosynthesis